MACPRSSLQYLKQKGHFLEGHRGLAASLWGRDVQAWKTECFRGRAANPQPTVYSRDKLVPLPGTVSSVLHSRFKQSGESPSPPTWDLGQEKGLVPLDSGVGVWRATHTGELPLKIWSYDTNRKWGEKYPNFRDKKRRLEPWLVWLRGLSASLQTKGSQVQFPIQGTYLGCGQGPQ